MCTVTLRRDARGLLLTMNRDELRARADESPPEIGKTATPPLRWLGPRDGARGGTWIGVNETGLCACLMNGNVPIEASIRAINAGAPSRGAIVPKVLGHPTWSEALEWIKMGFDYRPYPAFMLLVAQADQATLATWWGKGDLELRALDTPWAMVTSSQWETAAVLDYSARVFADWLAAGATFNGELPAFHHYQKAGEAAYGIWVDRDYACTRSITQVDVGVAGPVRMRYATAESLSAGLREFRLPDQQASSPA